MDRQGLDLDVWCESDEELEVFQTEIDATPPSDRKRLALLLFEVGRICISADNEQDAAQAFLRSYKLRPQFRPTLRLARNLYMERMDYHLAIKLIEAEARATRDPFTRAALLRQQACMLWGRIGNIGEAREVLEVAHRLDAADLATLKLQELLCVIDRDPDQLRSSLLRQIESISDGKLQTALLTDLALMLSASDGRDAIDTLRSAEKREPRNLAVLCYMEQLYESEGSTQELADTLIRQAEDAQAGEAWRARQLARAARIHRDQIKDTPAAVDLFEQSLALHREFGVAADCFSLLCQEGPLAAAVEVGSQLFELEEDAGFRAPLAYQMADILRGELDRRRDAAGWFMRCLECVPNYQPALEGLGWILEQDGEVEQLIKVHRADLARTRDPRGRAQRLYRIAALMERHDRGAEAMEVHQEALNVFPTFQPSSSSLERLYTRHQRWSELLQLYDSELGRRPDRERFLYISEMMADIWHHHLEHPENAIECYQRILSREPKHLSTIRAMARLCAQNRRWHDLVELNEREVTLVSDTCRQVEILQRTGVVWEYNLLNLDRAMDCYGRALKIDPLHLPALKALGRLYRQKGRWKELISMHRAEIEASGDPEQVLSLLYDIAEICEEELLDEQQAMAAYRQILQQRANHLPAVTALGRLLVRHTDWAGLVELLENTLDAVEDNQSKALQLWRVGLLREEHLDDAEGATRDFSRALRLAPDLTPALAALEQLLEERGAFAELAELLSSVQEQVAPRGQHSIIAHKLADLWLRNLDNPRKAAKLFEEAIARDPAAWYLWSLVQIYQGLGMDQEQIRVLELLADTLDDPHEEGALQLRIGQIKQTTSRGDPLPNLHRSLKLRAGTNHAARAIERILRDTGNRSEMASLLADRLQDVKDPLERAVLWTELAEVHLERSDPEAAERAYIEALKHSMAHLGAIHGLGQLLEKSERWEERARLAEREAEVLESSRGLAEALLKAAVLWQDRVGNEAHAIPLLQRVQEIVPGHPVAYLRLHGLLTARDDWAGLASLIRSQITSEQDPLNTSRLFTELGRLYLEKLDQPRKGEACLRRTLELDPTCTFALSTLGNTAFNDGAWDLALDLYCRLETYEEDPALLVQIHRRLGDLHSTLGDPAAALAAYGQAATGAAGDDAALLRKICAAAEACGDVVAQAAALGRLAGCSEDAGERVSVRKKLAQLAETILEDDDLAVRTLDEALILDPLDIDTIERLAAIHGRRSNRSAANQHLQAAVAHHRAELSRRPFEHRLYSQLGRIFQWQRLFDRFYCACVVQIHLGLLDEVQQRFLWNHHQSCATTPHGALSRSQLEAQVLPEEVVGPVRDLLSSAGLGLQKRATVPPGSLGLDKSCRVKKDHPIRAVCDEISALMGGVDFDLWISRTQPDLIVAEMLTRPSLVLGQRVAQSVITPAERFRIGKALFLISENAMVLRDLSVREMGHIVVALGAIALPRCDVGIQVKQPEKVDAEAKRLTKLLSRRDRKVIGSVLPQMREQLAAANLGDFARGLGYGSNRLGLIAAGDPKLGLEEAGPLAGGGHKGPEMADLLQYMVSDEYFTLRQVLQIAPGGSR